MLTSSLQKQEIGSRLLEITQTISTLDAVILALVDELGEPSE
jgi:hypothetical protein